MGMKVRWHPTQRVYHPWHPAPPAGKFDTMDQQERFIRLRAAAWDWAAYDGLDPSRNRAYGPSAPAPGEWERITTERGTLTRQPGNDPTGKGGRTPRRGLRAAWREHGFIKGSLRAAGRLLLRLGE